jgi:hypothetical protein
MNCKKCNSIIPHHVWDNGKMKVTNCRRVFCYECSPRHIRSTRLDMIMCNKKCIRCGVGLQNNRRNYCHSCNVIRSRQRKKITLVEYKGGKCQICNYNKCISNLSFHHLDPAKKNFPITQAMDKPMELLKQEANKCILVCCRCHGEIHAGMLSIGSGSEGV